MIAEQDRGRDYRLSRRIGGVIVKRFASFGLTPRSSASRKIDL